MSNANNNDSMLVSIPAPMLTALLDATAELAGYVGEEGRDPDTGILVARDTALAAAEAISTRFATGK